jgi:MerR family transcriptional regulator, mercuric resistance operon regulatory protein
MANEQPLALSIGEAARQSGVNIETIRFYERGGLLEAPPRTTGGHRVYDRPRIKRLAFVRRGRELGFTLDEIRGLLALADERETSCAQVEVLARVHLDEIRGRMADLARMESVLAAMIGRCAGGTVPDCPILETLFDGAPPKPNPG